MRSNYSFKAAATYYFASLFVGLFLFSNLGHSKIHWNKPIGKFKNYHHIEECTGTTLLTCMNTTLYPTIKKAADQDGNKFGRDFLGTIKDGIGVEFQLTRDVTTYHVKYEKLGEEEAQKSGRSFAAVGSDLDRGWAKYLADISYMDYFDALEDVMYDKDELEKFFEAILLVLIDSDPSGFDRLSTKGQRLAGDFIAVYIAEQYRRMIPTDGDGIGRSQIWDDAHLQVTLLSAFHSGQGRGEFKMYFRGEFTDRTASRVRGYYDADTSLNKRAEMQDYTQLGRTRGSGVNVTRRDFLKLGKEITDAYGENSSILEDLEQAMDWEVRGNAINAITTRIVNNSAPRSFSNPKALVQGIVDFLMDLQSQGEAISVSLR